jgi:hypothetical protein
VTIWESRLLYVFVFLHAPANYESFFAITYATWKWSVPGVGHFGQQFFDLLQVVAENANS